MEGQRHSEPGHRVKAAACHANRASGMLCVASTSPHLCKEHGSSPRSWARCRCTAAGGKHNARFRPPACTRSTSGPRHIPSCCLLAINYIISKHTSNTMRPAASLRGQPEVERTGCRAEGPLGPRSSISYKPASSIPRGTDASRRNGTLGTYSPIATSKNTLGRDIFSKSEEKECGVAVCAGPARQKGV